MHDRGSVLAGQASPMLALVPLAVLASAVLFDFGSLISGVRFYGGVAYYDIAVGLLTGMVALSVQLVEVLTAPVFSLVRHNNSVISACTATLVIVFALVWWMRFEHGHLGNAVLLMLEVPAVFIGGVGVWLARAASRPVEAVVPTDPFQPDEPASRVGFAALTIPSQLARPAVVGQPTRLR